MNVHVTEQQKQHTEHIARQNRLWPASKVEKPKAIAVSPKINREPTKIDNGQFLRKRIAYLETLVKELESSLIDATDRLKAATIKTALRVDERIQKLELDLADAHARILSQAQIITAMDSLDEPGVIRRPIPIIVAEVLKKYPGITCADIVSVRRTKDLVTPRKECHAMVCAERDDLSLPAIARYFKRDHTTIIHSKQTFNLTR